ncbi:hypothetical protein ACX1C1_17675 [Paenibacillus sp. strain BS8-2]
MDKKQQAVKRSFALPITLLLLVMSVMGNVLLYTKNIEHTRGQTEEEGRAIFENFEHSRSELANWSKLASQTAELGSNESGASRLLAGFLADALSGNESGIDALLGTASTLNQSTFAEAPQAYESYAASLQQELTQIRDASGALTESELSALDAMITNFANLDAIIGEFHFTGKDSHNVLIRLAGGHDWLDIAEKLLVAVRQ